MGLYLHHLGLIHKGETTSCKIVPTLVFTNLSIYWENGNNWSKLFFNGGYLFVVVNAHDGLTPLEFYEDTLILQSEDSVTKYRITFILEDN
jgi:hypothetical protein